MKDWILDLINSWGSFGVGLAMLLENVFPPIPSEVVMPAAGYAARQGDVSFVAVVIAGSIGSILGALFWYYIALAVGEERLLSWLGRWGAWVGVTRREADKALDWFNRHGSWVVLVGRLVPGVRTLISIPAGFAGMGLTKFLLWTTIGTVGWTLLLAAIGWWLQSEFQAIEPYIGWISTAVIAALVGWWLFRIAKQHGHKPAR